MVDAVLSPKAGIRTFAGPITDEVLILALQEISDPLRTARADTIVALTAFIDHPTLGEKIKDTIEVLAHTDLDPAVRDCSQMAAEAMDFFKGRTRDIDFLFSVVRGDGVPSEFVRPYRSNQLDYGQLICLAVDLLDAFNTSGDRSAEVKQFIADHNAHERETFEGFTKQIDPATWELEQLLIRPFNGRDN